MESTLFTEITNSEATSLVGGNDGSAFADGFANASSRATNRGSARTFSNTRADNSGNIEEADSSTGSESIAE